MKFHSFLTSPDFCGSELMGESWTAYREVLARLWDRLGLDSHLSLCF